MIVARRIWSALLGVALAVVCLVAGATVRSVAETAPAQRLQVELPDRGVAFTDAPDQPLLDTERLAPGRSVDGRMGVRNGSGGPATLSLTMVDIHEINRCTGCSGGHLGDLLTFTIDVSDQRSGAYARVWTGTATELARGVPLSGAVVDRAVRWVRITAVLPRTASNDVQTEVLRFGLRVSLAAGVLGTSTTVVGEHRTDGMRVAGLAVTGGELGVLTAVAGVLLAAGLIVMALGRRRPGPARPTAS